MRYDVKTWQLAHPYARPDTYLIKGAQGTGKTMTMVAMIELAVSLWGYSTNEIYVNFPIRIPGAHCLDNEHMLKLLDDMSDGEPCHLIVGITEADGEFSHRWYGDKQQTQRLMRLWQTEKNGNVNLMDAHRGLSVDLLIREAAGVVIYPTMYREQDIIRLECFDNDIGLPFPGHLEVGPISYLQTLYDRWEHVTMTKEVKTRWTKK